MNTNEGQILWQVKMGIQSKNHNKMEVGRLKALGYITEQPDQLDITRRGREALRRHRRRNRDQ